MFSGSRLPVGSFYDTSQCYIVMIIYKLIMSYSYTFRSQIYKDLSMSILRYHLSRKELHRRYISQVLDKWVMLQT